MWLYQLASTGTDLNDRISGRYGRSLSSGRSLLHRPQLRSPDTLRLSGTSVSSSISDVSPLTRSGDREGQRYLVSLLLRRLRKLRDSRLRSGTSADSFTLGASLLTLFGGRDGRRFQAFSLLRLLLANLATLLQPARCEGSSVGAASSRTFSGDSSASWYSVQLQPRWAQTLVGLSAR